MPQFMLRRTQRIFTVCAITMMGCLLMPGLFWQPAMAATTLQLEDGFVLSFDSGQIDIGTGSGQMSDVILEKDGEILMMAEQLDVTAEGAPGSDEWVIRDLQGRHIEMPEQEMFISDLSIREFNFGLAFNTNSVADASQIFGEGGLIRMRNINLAEGDLAITIDEISTAPFQYGTLADGTMVMTKGGFRVDGLSLTPMRRQSGDSGFMKRLRARGMDSLVMDMAVSAGARIVDPEMQVFYRLSGDIRRLGSFDLDVEAGINGNLYAQLLPQLQTAEPNTAAWLGLSSAAYLRNAGLVIHDTGIGDILLDLAAEDEAGDAEELRTTLRVMLAESVRATFPQNASWMLPPMDSILKAGGHLEIQLDPPAQVPFSSVMGFAMLPDLAIQQLGVQITHRPN